MRDVSLTPRIEAVRDEKKVQPPQHFSLEEIMQHYKESLNNIKEQFVVADSMYDEGNIVACKMIWRSQIVLSEGLLDFYIHELSKYCLFQMFVGQWNKSDKYEQIMVPMIRVEEALNATESKEWFFDYLNSKLCRDVYLAAETMKDQLNLIGIGFTNVMNKVFGGEKDPIDYGKKRIKELYTRRNEIAHQNDRSHLSAEQTDISKEYVEEYIETIDKIVNATHFIALAKSESDFQ